MKRRSDGPANDGELARRTAGALDDLRLCHEPDHVSMTLFIFKENVITSLQPAELTEQGCAQCRARKATALIAPVEDRHLIVFRPHCQAAMSLKHDDWFVVAQRPVAHAQAGLACQRLRLVHSKLQPRVRSGAFVHLVTDQVEVSRNGAALCRTREKRFV